MGLFDLFKSKDSSGGLSWKEKNVWKCSDSMNWPYSE